MAKGKNFAASLGNKKLTTLIPNVKKETKIEENASPEVPKKAPKAPTTVTTFRIDNELLFSVKAVAFWERQKIQDVLGEALKNYLDSLPPATLKKAKEEYAKRNT